MKEITCRDCGKTFVKLNARGRDPVRCEGCRTGNAIEKPAKPRTGRTRASVPRKPERAGESLSDGLAASLDAARKCLAWVRQHPAWSARGYQRSADGTAGVVATLGRHTERMEWRDGKPVMDAKAFKHAIRSTAGPGELEPKQEPRKPRKPSKASKPAAPARKATGSRSATATEAAFERSKESVRELAAFAREHGWEAQSGWMRNTKLARVTATRGKESVTLTFDNGQPTSSVDNFKRRLTR